MTHAGERVERIVRGVQRALNDLIEAAAIAPRLSPDSERPNEYVLRLVAFVVSVDRNLSYEERTLCKLLYGTSAEGDPTRILKTLTGNAPPQFLSVPPEFIRELIAADRRNGTEHSIRAMQLVHLMLDSVAHVDGEEARAEVPLVAGVPAVIAEAIVGAGLTDRAYTMKVLSHRPSAELLA